MLAIARAMAALCASIGRLLAHCSDMPERLSASDARRAARPAPAFRDGAGARLRAAAANRRVAVRRRAGGDGSVSPPVAAYRRSFAWRCRLRSMCRREHVRSRWRSPCRRRAIASGRRQRRACAGCRALRCAWRAGCGRALRAAEIRPRANGRLGNALDRFLCAGARAAPRARGRLRAPSAVFAPRRACFEARGAGSADGRRGRPFVVDFLSAATERVGASSSGCGRQTIRSLPRCWTGAASSSLQIRRSTSSRTARSSSATRTLMSSWARRLVSISFSTAGVSPWWPTMTTGWSVCAFARSARRSGGGSVLMPRFYRARRGPDRTAGRRRCDGRIVMHKPV